jgi:hypothetical protein
VALMVQRLRATLSVSHAHGSCLTLRIPEPNAPEAAAEQDWQAPRAANR